MATNKFDLHTAEYSVSGWDTILAADMEVLDEIIPLAHYRPAGRNRRRL